MKTVAILLTILSASLAPACMTAQTVHEVRTYDQAADVLKRYAVLQKKLNIQNPDLAYAMRQALLMADLLINADGTLNLGASSGVQSAFISPNPREYEVNMSKVIRQLSPSWNPIFDRIHAPTGGSALLALRALFSLPPEENITDRHAKVAVLSAMLAPYNQGPVGDCFAVSDVIRDHEEYYLRAAEDYSSIAMNGYVSRPVDGKTDFFFFLPDLADTDRDQPFKLTIDGKFPNGNGSLLNAPGFSAAVAFMGGGKVPNLEAHSLSLLSQYAQNGMLQLTPSQVIAALASVVAANNPNANAADLSALGEYGFSSLTNHPILRGVESAFAAMAEDRPNDSVRSDINRCIDQALAPTWKKIRSMDKAAAFHQAFSQIFNASYRLLYNLDIPLPQVSNDGSSTDGGFQLYKRAPGNDQILGTRVATPQDLQQLVLDAISATKTTLGQGTDVQAVQNALVSFVQTEDFLKNALWAYDPANQKQPDPVGNYSQLGRTPMQSCNGDNPYEVDDIDTGASYEKTVQTHKCRDAKDLLSWSLTLAKLAPQEFCPMNSPQHAFNFAPANPDLRAFLKSGLSENIWIQNRLITPGIQISKRPMDTPTAQGITNGMYNQLTNVLPDMSGYNQLVQNLLKKKLSLSDFATQFVKGVNHLIGSNATQAKEVTLIVDTLLLQNLPANDQAILSQSAVRFALTNWNQGTEEIYFCGYFNPRTELVAFGTILEDKTNLQPMDEDPWVNHQEWDVDLNPTAPQADAANQAVGS